MSIFSAEWRPSNLTFKHDRTQTPPITVLAVAMTTEDFRGNIIGSTDSGIRHDSPRLSPVINDTPVTYSKVDLIEVYGIAMLRLAGLSLEKILVVCIVMELMEAR
jgi:hypothetical protein